MHKTQKTGIRGEQIARDYLRGKKYKIVTTNYRTRIGEIDIIAEDPAQTLVFVEVKTLAVPLSLVDSEFRIFPEDHMTAKKYKKVARVSEQFCLERKLQDRTMRIDLVSVEINPENQDFRIRHIENAVP